MATAARHVSPAGFPPLRPVSGRSPNSLRAPPAHDGSVALTFSWVFTIQYVVIYFKNTPIVSVI